MTKISLTAVILMAGWAAAGQSGIKFRNIGLEKALEEAGKEQKLLFVEGYADWSQPCAILEEYTFSNKEVGAYFNEHFVNIQVDMEGYPGEEFADYYGVTSFPTLLFLDAEGNIVHQGCGAIDADELLVLAENASGEKSLKKMEEKFVDGFRKADFLVELSHAMEAACLDKVPLVSMYFENLPREQWTDESSWAIICLNVEDPYSEQFQYLVKNKSLFVAKYGKDTVENKIYTVLLDQLIAIYEGEDLTLFAAQALKQLAENTDIENKNELISLAELKASDLKQDWKSYAKSVIQVVEEQKVTDPDQLNEFAWNFYLYVDNKDELSQAIAWMAEVVKQYPDATYYDTYASLLYKLGDQKNAIKYANLALDAAEKELEDLTHYKEQLRFFQSAE